MIYPSQYNIHPLNIPKIYSYAMISAIILKVNNSYIRKKKFYAGRPHYLPQSSKCTYTR